MGRKKTSFWLAYYNIIATSIEELHTHVFYFLKKLAEIIKQKRFSYYQCKPGN